MHIKAKKSIVSLHIEIDINSIDIFFIIAKFDIDINLHLRIHLIWFTSYDTQN